MRKTFYSSFSTRNWFMSETFIVSNQRNPVSLNFLAFSESIYADGSEMVMTGRVFGHCTPKEISEGIHPWSFRKYSVMLFSFELCGWNPGGEIAIQMQRNSLSQKAKQMVYLEATNILCWSICSWFSRWSCCIWEHVANGRILHLFLFLVPVE